MVVHVRGVTWQFLDFTKRLPATDNVASLIHTITTRHGGSINGLTLYKDEVHPRNLLSDPRRTLDAVGFAPSSDVPTGTDPEVIVYYDLAPHTTACPLILRAPLDNKVNARHAVEEKAKAPPVGRGKSTDSSKGDGPSKTRESRRSTYGPKE